MRFYLTADSELVPFKGLPYLHEAVSAATNISTPLLEQLRDDAVLYLNHPNMLYLHPDCEGFFDRMDNNPYMISVATFPNTDSLLHKLESTTHIFRRLDLRQPDSYWFDYLKDRHNHLQPVFRKALITEFLHDNA